MSSDDSDAEPHHRRKRKVRLLEDSPTSASTSSSGSPIIGSSSRVRRRAFRPKKHPVEETSDSDSDSISLIPRYKRKKVGRVASDTDSESSGSTIVKRTKRMGRIASDVESDHGFEGTSSSQWETDMSDAEGKIRPEIISSLTANDIDSDSSDGQSEKCPICLLSFKQQEIGTPEACDHMFCLECIQEWSKNMNTCPVDRQEYNLILVRKDMNGKVARQIPIEKPTPQNDVDIVEDPTFCEICGTSDNEDRMLLCDGCDLGFHLYCLTPPLRDIPPGAWFCNECSPEDDYTSEIELYEIQLLLDDVEGMERPQGPRRDQSARLIPRTRQSERVRRRIANNRQQTSMNEGASSHINLDVSRVADRVSSSTSRVPRRKKSKKKKRSPKVYVYKTVYEIDETTGETISVRKRQRKQRISKRSKRRRTNPVRPRTVKKRLATQLGICASRAVPQHLPDVKVPNTVNSLGGMRWQAGIPTLHIFGRSNELDYFSGDEDEDYGGGSQLIARRAHVGADASALRRVARRKAVIAAPSAVSSSTDLLDSILSSQEQFHSRNVSYSVDSSGRFKVEGNSSTQAKYLDITKQKVSNRQKPNYENQNSENNSSYNSRQNPSNYHSHSLDAYHSTPTSTMEPAGTSSYGGGDNSEVPQDYTQRTLCASSEASQDKKDKDEANTGGTNTPNSESEVDIYSDIETVSTSKVDEGAYPRPPSPPILSITPNTGTDCDDNNDSEPDMVIDDDKVQECDKMQEETAVTSTVGYSSEFLSTAVHSPSDTSSHSCMEIQSGAIQSSTLADNKHNDEDDDSADGCPNTSIYSKDSINVLKDSAEDIDSDDGCPNFSIYSKESKSVALHTDISLSAEDNTQTQQEYQVGEISSSPNVANHEDFQPQSPQSRDESFTYAPEQHRDDTGKKTPDDQAQNDSVKVFVSGGILGGLYSDSEDETVVKKDNGTFAISDINHMTEDISEEERSYTPCLDERATRQGLEGLDTEMISDEERNDFDESHELKTVSDGDALEINAKESELDFTRPEDYEEGEIVDKNKAATVPEEKEPEEKEKEKRKTKPKKDDEQAKEPKKPAKKKDKEKAPTSNDHDKSGNKENEVQKEASFKKLSKNNKERNYRDKDKETRQHSPSKPKESREQNKKERKREKRKELERYNVRAIIAEKPRPQIVKDQFGRDIRRTPTRSRSPSLTPPPVQSSPSRARASPSKTRRSLSRRRSMSRTRKSASKERGGRKRRPRSRPRSLSRSRSRSVRKKRPGSKTKKRKRSPSRYDKRRKSRDGSKNKKKRSGSRHRTRSVTPRGKRDWPRREWSRTLSMSPSPDAHHMSPSWTPPKVTDNSQALRNENLTVVLNNSNKKKKEKRRKSDKRGGKDAAGDSRQKKRRHERERTPPPSKEVFASGDNILVSVSFNNENETRDVTTRDRRKKDAEDLNKKKKERRKNKNRRDLSGVKPVAIIDLERSPFKEITPSPKDIIVLSDSDNNDNETVTRSVQKGICDSSQQVASPERTVNYSTGPKTPPEPQIKFSLNPKPPQVRAINNPLHEPDDMEPNDDVQEDISSRINEGLHKGPNTPPEPPNSPPSSPDAYDPFEPTKSRSPTPDPMQASLSTTNMSESNNDIIDSRTAIDMLEKSNNPPAAEVVKSLTPPIADIQPADSQSSIQATPESNLGKSPERIGVVINQTVQPSLLTSKPVAQTTPFSSVPTSMVTSTPVSSNLAPSRINILNSTIITPTHVASSIPQRIVLPNIVKSSPVKIPPTKAAIKSTPIKPMPNKNKSSRKSRNQNGSGGDDIVLDFDSPYSPGSSDYEDLFEPPSENVIKSSTKSSAKANAKTPQKHQSTFDALFGSPGFNKSKNKLDKNKFGKRTATPTKTKTVGVKLDEDNLKILDDLPNSAVEMQVKDKFLKKLNRQERVVEEVKLVLKPHYNKKRISKEEYKDILRRSVPKICHNKSGEINPTKIKNLIEAYVKKIRQSKKVTSSSSVNPQKVIHIKKRTRAEMAPAN